jgi:hypothetical protein
VSASIGVKGLGLAQWLMTTLVLGSKAIADLLP